MNPSNIDYEMLFSTMIIRDDWKKLIETQAEKILSKKPNYDIAVARINPRMPWYFIGIIHSLECSLNFNAHFHNGDSLRQRTTHVPAGRPLADPVNGFPAGYTWIESVTDAMEMKGYAITEHWRLEDILYRFESYNGFGYEKYHNIYSPYLWSGTEFYSSGKYGSDGKFDPNLISNQVGAAPLLGYLTVK